MVELIKHTSKIDFQKKNSHTEGFPKSGHVCGKWTCGCMWSIDLWVLHVCSCVDYGLVGLTFVFQCGIWTCGSGECAPMWNVDL